jgi:hypothetical protein
LVFVRRGRERPLTQHIAVFAGGVLSSAIIRCSSQTVDLEPRCEPWHDPATRFSGNEVNHNVENRDMGHSAFLVGQYCGM